MNFHLSIQYSDSPISVNTNPTTDTTMTMLPIMRFSIQMPRKLNCVRTLLTKGNAKPPCQSAQCDGQVSSNGLEYQHSLTYKSEAGEKAYKKEYNQRIESVTANAVMKL